MSVLLVYINTKYEIEEWSVNCELWTVNCVKVDIYVSEKSHLKSYTSHLKSHTSKWIEIDGYKVLFYNEYFGTFKNELVDFSSNLFLSTK